MLDAAPVQKLRIRPQDLARRAALEQRKLRVMIAFCYAEDCYRAVLLDYFGDSDHPARCGTCGNCVGQTNGATRTSNAAGASAAPLDPPSALDGFVRRHVPIARDLETTLAEQSRFQQAQRDAEAYGQSHGDNDEEHGGGVNVTTARDLTDDEALRVRKLLACVARAEGRFGKHQIAACLRGSRSAKITQAGLDHLSTYGLLKDMTQDAILLYLDALVAAGCLHITGGAYPTVGLTGQGRDVMRERAGVQLALPPADAATIPAYDIRARVVADNAARSRNASLGARVSTVEETYAFYRTGMSVEEIAQQRALSEMTVEKHLADCILAGREFDLARYVSPADRSLIEAATAEHGTERLKPLRDALPGHVTYRMIRFVVADLERGQQGENA